MKTKRLLFGILTYIVENPPLHLTSTQGSHFLDTMTYTKELMILL